MNRRRFLVSHYQQPERPPVVSLGALSRWGQSTGEYAVLIAIVIGAAVAMQQYVRARLAGKIKAQADQYSATQLPLSDYQTSQRTQKSRTEMPSSTTGTITTSGRGTSESRALE